MKREGREGVRMDVGNVSHESAVEPQKPRALGARKPKNRLGGKGAEKSLP